LLKKENIIGGFLVFTVIKTINTKQNMLRIPLNENALQLISDEPPRFGQLFHVISDQKMNDFIKVICKDDKVKIFKQVSNHTGRHTFATLWLKKTKDLAALQILLGHSDIKETMIYVHVDDDQMIEDMAIFQKDLWK
jgi:integrase